MSHGTIPCGYPGCTKVFVHKEHRNRHAKTHDTNQRPICPICNKPFSREDSLRRHMQQHEQRGETVPSQAGYVAEMAPPMQNTAEDVVMTSTEDDSVPHTLEAYLLRNPIDTMRLIQVYATNVHPYWPILHVPSIELRSTAPILLGAMAMLAQWSLSDDSVDDIASLVFQARSKAVLNPSPSLPVLQSQLLSLVYLISNIDDHRAEAMRLNAVLVTHCRFLGYFSGDSDDCRPWPEKSGLDKYEDCITREQKHRLAFYVMQADAYLSIITDTPPLVRHHEIQLPVGMPDSVWLGMNEQRYTSWSRIMMIEGRMRPPFDFIVQESLDLVGVSSRPADSSASVECYHYLLLGLQNGVFDSARQRRLYDRFNSLFPSPTASEDRFSLPLHSWREAFERDYAPRKTYYGMLPASGENANATPQQTPVAPSPTTSIITPHTPFDLTLYHMACLQLVAPVELLWRPAGALLRDPHRHLHQQRITNHPHTLEDQQQYEQAVQKQYERQEPQMRPAVIGPERPDMVTRVYGWAATAAQSRQALWHAAQLLRVVLREMRRVADDNNSSNHKPNGNQGGGTVSFSAASSVYPPTSAPFSPVPLTGPAGPSRGPPPPQRRGGGGKTQQQQQVKRMPCLTPLLTQALLASATVLSTYACLRRVCPGCTDAERVMEVIHDLSAVDEDVDIDDDGDDHVEAEGAVDVGAAGSNAEKTRRGKKERKVVRWLRRGEDILPGLGWMRPLCRCQFRGIAGRFRGLLERVGTVGGGDRGMEQEGAVRDGVREFVGYLRDLEKIQAERGCV